jgi:polyisoprenyl-phosphate glycosyltransferase
MADMIEFSIVLPVRDEAAVLSRVLDDIYAAFDLRLEIIAPVDSRSSDGSLQILEEYAKRRSATVSELRIIHLMPPQCGSGAARRIGSTETRGPLVGWMDADGTYTATDLRRLMDKMQSADQMIGTRSRDFGYAGRLRFFVKATIAKLAARLWRCPQLVDLNSGLRVFKRDALLKWISELPDGFSCTSTATLAALNHGQVVHFTPISYFSRERGSKSKFHPVFDTARLLRVVLRQWLNRLERGLTARRAENTAHW